MIYGYVNIRKEAINQEKILETYSGVLKECGVEKIIVETDGNMLQDLLDCLMPGDSVHVIAMAHLARSTARLLEISHYFQKNNISLYERNQQVNWNMILIANEIAQRPYMYLNEE